MTPEELDAIEARAKRVLTNGTTSGSAIRLAKDVLALILIVRTEGGKR